MFCRRAFQRVGPLARRAFRPTSRNAPVRHMAFGVPGGSSNMAYIVLCGGGVTAAVVYAYKTVGGNGERHEDRLATMAVIEKAPEVAAPAAEPAALEEAAPTPEVLAEVVEESGPAPAEPVAEAAAEPDVLAESIPAEPVAETAPEPAVEAVSEEEAAAEVVVAEPAPTEEAAPAAVEDESAATVEVAATEETPAEAPAAEAHLAESAESLPDLLTAVKVLAGPPIEIAAASVENSLVEGLDFPLKVVEPEAVEATTEEVAKEAQEVTMVNEEESKPADAEQLVEEGTAASVEAALEEEVAASLSEEATTSVLAVEEEEGEKEEEVQSEDQTADSAAVREEAAASSDTPPEDAAPAEEATTAAEAAPLDDTPPDAETWVDDVAAEALAATHSEAAAVVDASQLAAASSGSDLEVLSAAGPGATSEAPGQESKRCHSCHSAPSIAVEVAPPAALGVQPSGEEDVDVAEEVKEAESLVEGQKPKVSNWTVKSCSVM
nr:fibrous sheath CABYR-binding protein-like isoform X2 [Gasterosteus aculeatus aculeatus]